MASTLNYSPGRTVPNHAIVATGPFIGFYNFGGRAQLIVDIFGGGKSFLWSLCKPKRALISFIRQINDGER